MEPHSSVSSSSFEESFLKTLHINIKRFIQNSEIEIELMRETSSRYKAQEDQSRRDIENITEEILATSKELKRIDTRLIRLQNSASSLNDQLRHLIRVKNTHANDPANAQNTFTRLNQDIFYKEQRIQSLKKEQSDLQDQYEALEDKSNSLKEDRESQRKFLNIESKEDQNLAEKHIVDTENTLIGINIHFQNLKQVCAILGDENRDGGSEIDKKYYEAAINKMSSDIDAQEKYIAELRNKYFDPDKLRVMQIDRLKRESKYIKRYREKQCITFFLRRPIDSSNAKYEELIMQKLNQEMEDILDSVTLSYDQQTNKIVPIISPPQLDRLTKWLEGGAKLITSFAFNKDHCDMQDIIKASIFLGVDKGKSLYDTTTKHSVFDKFINYIRKILLKYEIYKMPNVAKRLTNDKIQYVDFQTLMSYTDTECYKQATEVTPNEESEIIMDDDSLFPPLSSEKVTDPTDHLAMLDEYRKTHIVNKTNQTQQENFLSK